MYFGSVRFFKNLILLAVILAILIPLVLAIHSYSALKEAQAVIQRQQEGTDVLYDQLSELRQQQAEAEKTQGENAAGKPSAQQSPNEPESDPAADFAADTPAYQSLFPDFYAPQPLGEQTRIEQTVYLTFNKSPSENTAQILEALADKQVKATFFVSGPVDENASQRIRDIMAHGHTVGMLSYSSDFNTIYSSVEAFLEDMYQIFTLIQDATGVTPTVFRFPGGSINSYNAGIYQELTAEMLRRGFVPCDWNVAGEDTGCSSSEAIVESVFSNVTDKTRCFVLLHDGASQDSTVQALGAIIERFQTLGFWFERIEPSTLPVLFSYTS